jgi:restriction system protein
VIRRARGLAGVEASRAEVAFLGGRRKGDRCLYVSTGGFTKEARYEAERAETSMTLVDIVRLRQLVVDLYDRLDPESRALIPLRHLYWPAGSVTPNR